MKKKKKKMMMIMKSSKVMRMKTRTIMLMLRGLMRKKGVVEEGRKEERKVLKVEAKALRVEEKRLRVEEKARRTPVMMMIQKVLLQGQHAPANQTSEQRTLSLVYH